MYNVPVSKEEPLYATWHVYYMHDFIRYKRNECADPLKFFPCEIQRARRNSANIP